MSGRVSTANSRSRFSVTRDSSRKVGRIRTVSASASLREASAPMKLFAFTISSRSWPRRSFTAASERPLLRISARRAGSSSSSTRSTSSPLATNPGRLPSASFRSSPRPS